MNCAAVAAAGARAVAVREPEAAEWLSCVGRRSHSALVSFVALPVPPTSAGHPTRRRDSLVRSFLASVTTGAWLARAHSAAFRRNSGGCGARGAYVRGKCHVIVRNGRILHGPHYRPSDQVTD